jgi:predicted site-specific integrase-resolvase
MMTTSELSKATGVPVSTLKSWIAKGHLRPAVRAWGQGDQHVHDENSAAQVRAILVIREWFGDGLAARAVIEQAIPHVKTGTARIRVPAFELALSD